VILSDTRGELIRYLVVGGLTTFVNWVVYALGVGLAGLPIAAGNTLAWLVAVLFAYGTNKIWVFKSRSWKLSLVLHESGLFFSGRIVTGLIEIVGVPLLVFLGLDQPAFGVEGFIAKAAVSIVVTILNYVLSKVFVFRKKFTNRT